MFFNYAVLQHSKNVGEKRASKYSGFSRVPGYISAADCKPRPAIIIAFLYSTLVGAEKVNNKVQALKYQFLVVIVLRPAF
jgi:hypothetical protein